MGNAPNFKTPKNRRETSKRWKKRNVEKQRAYARRYWQTHKEEKAIWDKKYYEKHKDKIKKYIKEWRIKYFKDSRNKILVHLRSRIHRALNGQKKNRHTLNLLGCSTEFFKNYLQDHFADGMTWDNYGRNGWHMDHIKPCCKFDLAKPEEQRKCFHYTNLQPLWAGENMKKGGRYNG